MPYTITEKEGSIGIRAEGKDAKDAFEQIALAMFHAMSDTDHLKTDERVKIVVEAIDMKGLCGAWLQELLDRHALHEVMFGEFHVASIQKLTDGHFLLTGSALGQARDEVTHLEKRHLSSVAHELLAYTESEGGCSCTAEIAA